MTAPGGALSERCSTRGCPEERLPLLVVCGRHATTDVICILIADLIRARSALAASEKERERYKAFYLDVLREWWGEPSGCWTRN